MFKVFSMLHSDKKIKILIVDDDEDDFFITSELITEIDPNMFQIEWTYRYKEALEHIEHQKHDIYFIDFFLGGKTGLDLLKDAVKYDSDVPMILLTGKGNRDIDKEAMKIGASDYLIKSELTTEKLERCIRYSIEKAQTLKQLRDNERKFRGIFEQSKDAIFLADVNLKFVTVNSAATQLFGYSEAELQSFFVYDLIADKNEAFKLASLLNSNEELDEFELQFLTKSNEEVICIFSATNFKKDNEDYLQVIVHDITKLRKAEKSALMAEKLAATGRLARTLGHEIRNPLTNIHLSAEHLLDTSLTEDQSEYIQIIQRNSRRISDIISELLNTSRPAEIIMKKSSLQDMINEGLAAVNDRILLKNIKLDVTFPKEIIKINADKNKLKIAFVNIFINAIEAIQDGGGKLSVELVKDGNQGCYVTITDNGIGISKENMQRLFEPYFTSKRNGVGLGLVTTHNILHAHNARVEVSSTPGEGTTFTITFSKNNVSIKTPAPAI